MINIENGSLLDILPSSFNEPALVALDYALKNQILKLLQYANQARLWSRVDSLNSNELDILAYDLNTPYYNKNLSAETKRELVKSTLDLYITMGTPSAVERLIKIVFGPGQLQEWFEYGGEPFSFKVITENNAVINEKADEFIRLLNSVKRESAHLDAVEVIAGGELKFTSPFISSEYDSSSYMINLSKGGI